MRQIALAALVIAVIAFVSLVLSYQPSATQSDIVIAMEIAVAIVGLLSGFIFIKTYKRKK